MWQVQLMGEATFKKEIVLKITYKLSQLQNTGQQVLPFI